MVGEGKAGSEEGGGFDGGGSCVVRVMVVVGGEDDVITWHLVDDIWVEWKSDARERANLDPWKNPGTGSTYVCSGQEGLEKG